MEYLPTFSNQLDADYISHHGIKGMHWGVRRYQNPDGSLTKAGKRRYSNTKTMYKDLKKQVHKQRAKKHGGSNGLMTLTSIGSHSEQYLNDISEKRKRYYDSDAYKKWYGEYDSFQKKWNKKFNNNPNYNKSMVDQYEKEDREMLKKRPRKGFKDPYDASARITLQGRKYTKQYLNGAGRDLSIAYIKDLGYSDATSVQMVDRLIKSGRTLGMD